jgi:hypothetical protein
MTAVMVVFLMSGVLALLYLQVRASWILTGNIEGQLQSIAMAENGVETARAIIADSNLDELLAGPDGAGCLLTEPGWRNPMPVDLARALDPREWVPDCNDGLVTQELGVELSRGLHEAQNGFFMLRFTNNPEESLFEDRDQVVVARSMGVVPERVSDPALSEIKNHVYLIEAKFRKETSFRFSSALTIGGDLLDIGLEGSDFLVEGNEEAGISFVTIQLPSAQELFHQALQPDQIGCFSGAGGLPSLLDATEAFTGEKRFSRLLTSEFWTHFEANLPDFADAIPASGSSALDGLFFMPEGGVINKPISGVVVAIGDVEISDGAEIDGLLLHLGRGRLVFKGNSIVSGAVWVSSFDTSGGNLVCDEIQLTLSESTQLIYDSDSVDRALQYLPATQLEWRVIFPEMSLD